MENIIKKQQTFFNTGKTRNPAFRKAALLRLKASLKKHQLMAEAALKKDLNKSAIESYLCETSMVFDELSTAIKNLDKWTRKTYAPTPIVHLPAVSFSMKEPYGVVLIMSPWNYPFLLSLVPLIGAIAAGNCCIIKPSAYSPSVSKVVETIIKDAFPSCYVSVIQGGREENSRLLEQRFDYIFFTGSPAVGKLVMEKASRHLTPVTLELGGKSPCIVDETADLKLAAKRIVFGKLLNSGQTCIAPDYLLVQESVKVPLIHYIKEEIRKQYGEEPLKNPDYPKIINRKHYDRLMTLMLGEGILTGGYGDETTLQIAPTLLDFVKKDAPVMEEEIFGPILPVFTFRRIQEAADFVLEKEKPLALYLFTTKRRHETYILNRISFGGGCINDTVIHFATHHMGFGGVGGSGMGSYHGKRSFNTFSHEKSIVKKASFPDLPLKYRPYSAKTEKLFRFFV